MMFSLVYNRKQFGSKLKMSVKKKCKCAYEILKNIVENRASFTSEQVIVSYPREIFNVSASLKKLFLRSCVQLLFPTMWQSNVSFRNFLCLFPYFWNWIKNRPGSLTYQSVREFSSNRNFWCWAYLHLQYLISSKETGGASTTLISVKICQVK